jgi:Ca2+-binding EF-hand superfamily protein
MLGDQLEKLKMAFKIYDIDKNGLKISLENLIKINVFY